MNLLKRSPPPPPPPPQTSVPAPHSVSLDIGRTVSCSIGAMGGENSAFRAVSSDPKVNSRQNFERKPSAFRMISQLVGNSSPKPASSASPEDERMTQQSSPEMRRTDEEDEEIDVQDSDQEPPSPSPTGAWRDNWTDQQPLELTKHDR